MSEILIFTHVDYCPPAYLQTFLEQRGLAFQEVRCDKGELAGLDLDRPKAVAIMGGGMSVNDPLPWIAEELAALRHFIARDIPLIGHCLGGQLLARALGAEVRAMPYTESGWQPMKKLADSPWLAQAGETFPIYQWHVDSFELPEGAVHLLESPWCRNQAFSWGEKLLALQGHPELTVEVIQAWHRDSRHLLDESQPSQENFAQSLKDLPLKVAQMNKLVSGFYQHWLQAGELTA